MLGLWTDSVVGAGVILLAVGYGRDHWVRWQLTPSYAVVAGALIVMAGVTVPQIRVGTITLPLSFLILGIMVLLVGILRGGPTWWLWWMGLATMMTLVRIILPLDPHRAQLVGTLAPESFAVGLAGGILTQDPVAGLIVAVGADILSSWWVEVYRIGYGHFAYHDLTSALLAALGGYVAGWLGYQWHRWRTSA